MQSINSLLCGPQELSQRALVSYLRSVFLQPNRAVFDVSALPVSHQVPLRQSRNDCTARVKGTIAACAGPELLDEVIAHKTHS